MSDLRELLDIEAHRVRERPDALPAVLRRADRRNRTRRLSTGLLALVLAASGVAIAATAFLRAPEEGRILGSDSFRGVWPQDTQVEAEAAQACADAGDPSCTWQTDADQVVHRYAIEELGWGEVIYLIQTIGNSAGDAHRQSQQAAAIGLFEVASHLDEGLADEVGPIYLKIGECHEAGPCGSMELVLERLIRHDVEGVWSITSTSSGQVVHHPSAIESPDPTPDETPIAPAIMPRSLEDFIHEFMEARLSGHGAERFLSPQGLDDYENSEDEYQFEDGNLSLYGYASGPGVSYKLILEGWQESNKSAYQYYGFVALHEQGTTQVRYESLYVRELPPGGEDRYVIVGAFRHS